MHDIAALRVQFADGMNSIDEAAVFNIALTAGQQQGIMSTGLGAAITAVEAIEKLATTWSSLKTE